MVIYVLQPRIFVSFHDIFSKEKSNRIAAEKNLAGKRPSRSEEQAEDNKVRKRLEETAPVPLKESR